MNETIQVLLTRRAIRAYENKPVSRADLETIVQCGQYAATGMGLQPWHFTVVTDRALLDQISQANRRVLLDDPNTPPPDRAAPLCHERQRICRLRRHLGGLRPRLDPEGGLLQIPGPLHLAAPRRTRAAAGSPPHL